MRLFELTGEIGFIKDGDWIESKDQDAAGEVRLLQLADVGDGVLLNRSNRFLTAEKAKELRCTELAPGDVLVARMGDPVGKACVFPQLEQRCITVVDVCIVRTDPNICLPEWLVGVLNSPSIRLSLGKLATGATRARFPTSKFRELELAVPAVSIQKIAAQKLNDCLHAIGDAVRGLIEQVQMSESMPVAILADAFSSICPISDGRSITLKCSPNWRWYKLLELARLESGHTPSRRHPDWWGGSVPWLALPDIRKLHGKYAYETTEHINEAGLANSSARLLPPGTVCLCRDASIGFVTILGRPMATTQHFANWICNDDELDPEFLMYVFMAAHDYLRELGSGSVIKTIYMPTIQSFHVCVPEINEQRRIARTLLEQLAAAEKLMMSLKARLSEIELMPQRLLAAAFRETI